MYEKYREEAAEYLKLLEEIDGSEFEEGKRKEIRQRLKKVKVAVKENIDSINLEASQAMGAVRLTAGGREEKTREVNMRLTVWKNP